MGVRLCGLTRSDIEPWSRHWSEIHGEAGGWNGAAPSALIAPVSPKPCRLGLAGAPPQEDGGPASRPECRRRRSPDPPALPPDGIGQRCQPGGGLDHPIGQRRAIQIETLALEDLTLAVERQVVSIFVDPLPGRRCFASLKGGTWASSPGPGLPRSIGRLGNGACVKQSQPEQAMGRTMRFTMKRPGTYSRSSVTSSPNRRSLPPHPRGVLVSGRRD